MLQLCTKIVYFPHVKPPRHWTKLSPLKKWSCGNPYKNGKNVPPWNVKALSSPSVLAQPGKWGHVTAQPPPCLALGRLFFHTNFLTAWIAPSPVFEKEKKCLARSDNWQSAVTPHRVNPGVGILASQWPLRLKEITKMTMVFQNSMHRVDLQIPFTTHLWKGWHQLA